MAQFEGAGSSASRAIPEFELLCACCRGSCDPSISGLLQERLDWGRVFELAAHHRVMPPLCAAVRNSGTVPADIRVRLNARFAQHQRRVLRFSAELAGILRQFENGQIAVMPFKGPVLSQVLYGDPALREFGDLDLLVRPADVPRARAALCEIGYEPKLRLPPHCEREYLRSGYELVFGSGAEKNLIELHWQILPRFYSVPFETEAIFERSRELKVEGRCVRIPRTEDLMLMLCVHAAKHEWSHLGMVRDIAALAGPELDWPWIQTEAVRLGVMRIVLTSLLLARNVLRWHSPAAAPPLNCGSETLAGTIAARIMRGENPNVESPPYFLLMMRLRERWRDRVRFAWRLASTPSVGEWKSVDLPAPLFQLYHGVRLARLASRFARSALNRVRRLRLQSILPLHKTTPPFCAMDHSLRDVD